MTILANLEVVPSRVKAVCRFVANEKAISEENLMAAMTNGTREVEQQFIPFLREVIDLGLIEKNDDNKIQLSPNISEEEVKDDDLLLKHLEKTLLKYSLNKDQKNNEFQRALTWLLTRSVEEKPITYRSECKSFMQTEMSLEDEDYQLTNNARTGKLVIWARYLGYIEVIDSQIISDPTRAIYRHLNLIFNSKKELKIIDFMRALGKISSVFEYGEVRNEINNKLKKKLESNYLSSSTSLALERLQLRRVLKLIHKGDAKALICNDESPTHVRFVKT